VTLLVEAVLLFKVTEPVFSLNNLIAPYLFPAVPVAVAFPKSKTA
jgi:hypothetical protein